MKPSEYLRAELRKIPNAMWEESGDPFERPRYPLDRIETLAIEDGERIFAEGPQSAAYPAFLDQEFLAAKDREIGIDSQQGRGIEALAWYVSFHVSRGTWGIFIPTSSLVYLELRHLNSLRLEQAAKRQVALEMLLEHEMLHFAVDYACAQWEVLLHAPCWRSLMQRRREKGLPYIKLEESLANAYMLRRLSVRWNIPVLKEVERFTCRQPSGYNNAGEYVEKGKFDTGLAELAKTYVAIHASERGLNVFSPCFDYASIFPVYPSVPGARCPIQIVKDLARFGIPEISVRFLKCIPEIVETELFQKLFSQMPHDIQKRWNRKKEQLKLMLPRHPEFENFRDHFSLRLGHNFRAHLRPVAGQTHWEAFEIGPHTKMGHG